MLSPYLAAQKRRTLNSSIEAASLHIERFAPYIAATLLLIIYVVATFKSIYRPLWLDEIFSTLVAKLPKLSDIVDYAKQGGDGQPIFYYWIVRASIWLFRSDSWGLRAPSTTGYLLFCLSLYLFVSRQTSRLYGLVALLLPNITGCWYYATEGRPYGLVMAGTGLTALCWQSIAMNRSRKLALAGLSLSLLFAFSVHYFATLLFVPFAAAELIRTLSRRKLDIPVWIGLAVPFLIMAWYMPIMRDSYKNVAGIGVPSFAKPAWFGSLTEFAQTFLGPGLIALLGLAWLYVTYVWFADPNEALEKYRIDHKNLFAYLVVVVTLTCLLPFAGIALGKFGTHQFFPRYVIGSMFGVIAMAALILWFAFRQSRTAALMVGLIFSLLLCHKLMFDVQEAREMRANPPEKSLRNRIPAQVHYDDRPIVIADGFHFFHFHYYGHAALRRRIYYVSSEEWALRVLGYTVAERLMRQSSPYFGTQVVDYKKWIKEHTVFYLLGGPDWIVPRLLKEGASLQMLQTGEDPWFRVTLPNSVSGSNLPASVP